MHRRIVVLATALCLSTLACAHDRVTPEEQLETATDHYEIALGSAQNGAYDDAKKHIEMALDAVPTHGDSLYLLGLLQLHEGRTIVEFIESEMCLTDEAALAQRERADELHRQAHESFDLATQAYTEDDPGLGRAYNSMAVVSLYFHDYERAKGELEHALDTQFYTEKYSALANLGWAYYEAGDLVAAMTELRQAVLINPDYCVGRYRLAQVYLDYDMTEAALEQAMTVVNDDRCPIQDVHRVAGIAQMRMGHSDAAGQSFRACLDLAPRSCLADACREFQTVAAAGAQTAGRAGSP